jgi:hypothetical protein
MVLFVFVADQHVPFCTARVAAQGTGLLGMGNKGAVAASLQLYDSSVCMVCSHLAAGSKAVQARNSEVTILQSGLRFPDMTVSWRKGAPPPPLSVGHHDVVIWFGDLNYRINLPDSDVRAHLEGGGSLQALLIHDELRQQQAAEETFTNFREGTITFRPTYKYDVGTDTYDTSEKRRAPAW